jgi:hypothetical protein
MKSEKNQRSGRGLSRMDELASNINVDRTKAHKRKEELVQVQKAIEAARAEGEKIQKAYHEQNVQEEASNLPANAF